MHNSGTGGVSQVDGGHVGIGTTNPEIAVHSGNNKILNVGIVTASSYYGDGSNLTNLPSQVTITGNADNRVITGGSGTNLNGESNFTFDGSTLSLTGNLYSSGQVRIKTNTNISNSGADDLQVGSGSGSQGITIYSGSSNNGSLYFADGASGNQSYRGFLEYNHTNDHMILGTAGNTRLQVKDDGQVILTGTSTGNHMSTFGSNVGGLTIDDVGNQHTALQVSHGSNNVFLVASSNNSTYFSSYGTGDMIFELTGNGSGSREKLRITSTGVIQTGSKTITGGNKLAIQNFAVKRIWSGAPSIGKSIELISGYDSSVKMAAVGYNLTDTNTGSTYGGDLTFHTQPLYSSPTTPMPVRMRVSSSGYVTKPSQPAFHAYGNNSWTQYTGSNNTVKLLNSNCNVGSHYKTSGSDEGKFVCPVAGNYLFYFTLYSGRTDNSQTDNNNYLSINLISSTGSLANKGGHHIAHYYNEADRDSTRTMSYIKTCAVGEKIYISVSCNGAGYQIYGGHSGFGGYLLG